MKSLFRTAVAVTSTAPSFGLLFALLAVFAGRTFATDMEHKARTVLTCPTAKAGVAEITCDNPGVWKFEASASQDGGRDVVTVRIRAPKDALPPPFGVYFRGSGADVQNVWTSDCSVNGDGRHLRPKLWWGWCSKYHSELANNMPLAVGFNSRDVAPVAVAVYPAYVLDDGAVGTNARRGVDAKILPQFAFDAKTPPVFLLHGDEDPFSSMASVRLYEELHRRRISVQLFVYSRAGHGFGDKINVSDCRSRVVDWLTVMGC